MELQQLIYNETLKWAKEAKLTLTEHEDASCIQLRDLPKWIDRNKLKRTMENFPTYGVREQGLIYIKYLPYLLSRLDVHKIKNPLDRDRIRELLERFGFMIPDTPLHTVYFVEFLAKEDQARYCKIGFTATSMKTRLNTLNRRQQIGEIAVDGTIKVVDSIKTGEIAVNDLEYAIKTSVADLRIKKFENGITVGKSEIYKLTPELLKLINSLKDKFCETRFKTQQLELTELEVSLDDHDTVASCGREQ